MYVDANVIVISIKASLNTLDRQNNVTLAITYPHSGPKAATWRKYSTISPPVRQTTNLFIFLLLRYIAHFIIIKHQLGKISP